MTRLTVATSFPIHPPRGGGQRRILGLYAALAARGVDVDVVALVDRAMRAGIRRLAPRLREIRVPKSREHDALEFRLYQAAGVPITDVALALHHDLTPEFGEALAASARGSAAVVASHPYAAPAIAAHCEAPLIYEAHNVEADLKADMIGEPSLLDAVREVEADCCARAHHVLVCSQEDRARLAELYAVEPERAVVVPNGVDPGVVSFTPPEQRAERKARVGLAETFLALFLGSWHEPNVVAAREILDAARARPGLRFVIVGGVGIPLATEDVPANVDICGVVDDRFVASVLAIADAALNPMRSGSGTNLKMLDYALAGVPLVSSEIGARGLGLRPGEHYLAAEPGKLPDTLDRLRDEPPGEGAVRVRRVHDEVLARFAWPAIAERWLASERWREIVDAVAA